MTFATRLPIAPVTLDGPALDRLMPMHLRLDAQGTIWSVGPTLAKLLPAAGVMGQMVGRVFSLRRPVSATQMSDQIGRASCRERV